MLVSSDDYIKKYEPLWGCIRFIKKSGALSIPTQEQHREALATIGNDKNVHLARKHKYSKLRRPPGAKNKYILKKFVLLWKSVSKKE